MYAYHSAFLLHVPAVRPSCCRRRGGRSPTVFHVAPPPPRALPQPHLAAGGEAGGPPKVRPEEQLSPEMVEVVPRANALAERKVGYGVWEDVRGVDAHQCDACARRRGRACLPFRRMSSTGKPNIAHVEQLSVCTCAPVFRAPVQGLSEMTEAEMSRVRTTIVLKTQSALIGKYANKSDEEMVRGGSKQRGKVAMTESGGVGGWGSRVAAERRRHGIGVARTPTRATKTW